MNLSHTQFSYISELTSSYWWDSFFSFLFVNQKYLKEDWKAPIANFKTIFFKSQNEFSNILLDHSFSSCTPRVVNWLEKMLGLLLQYWFLFSPSWVLIWFIFHVFCASALVDQQNQNFRNKKPIIKNPMLKKKNGSKRQRTQNIQLYWTYHVNSVYI